MVLKKLNGLIENELIEVLLKNLNTTINGLSEKEVEDRIDIFGYNEIGENKRKSHISRLADNLKNPLVILLSVLALISYLTRDAVAAIVMLIMVALGVVLKFIQEIRADDSAEKLKSMVSTTATVIRECEKKEIP